MRPSISIINRYVSGPGVGVVILARYAPSLVLMEWLHTLGMPSDFYLTMVWVWYVPIVWLIDTDCCPGWLEELLKWAATP